MATRLDTINKLAQRVPVMNAEAAKQLEAGRTVQLQQALGAPLPTAAPAARISQALAPQAVAQAGQIQQGAAAKNNEDLRGLAAKADAQARTEAGVQQTERSLAQDSSIANASRTQQLGISRADMKSQKVITKSEIDSAKRAAEYGIEQDNRLLNLSLSTRRELAAVGSDVKNQIFDSRLQFERDEAGRKFSNDRQMMDYTIATAESEDALQNRLREMKQVSDKKMMLMEHSAQQLVEAVKRGWLTKEQKLDYEQKKYLLELAKKMEEKIAKDKAKAANKLMVAQGIGTVVGAGVGLAASGGNPMGAAAGATIGGSIGSLAAGSF